jgi:hypothetical protein
VNDYAPDRIAPRTPAWTASLIDQSGKTTLLTDTSASPDDRAYHFSIEVTYSNRYGAFADSDDPETGTCTVTIQQVAGGGVKGSIQCPSVADMDDYRFSMTATFTASP